jgi:hypothetical protein
VKQWIHEEKTIICTDGQRAITTEWKLHYFKLLQLYYSCRGSLISSGGTTQQISAHREKLFNMDSQLAQLEIKHNITRWKQSDPEYVSAKTEDSITSQKLTYASLRVSIVKRQFLLKLKAKYADGQKIANRLSNGIGKETNRARQLLDEYNAISSEITPSFPPLSLSDVLSPDSDIWTKHAQLEANSTVPSSLKKDITEAYLLMKRCEEELELLTAEMHNALEYWKKCIDCIKNSIDDAKADSSSQYSRGVASLLQQHLWVIELTYSRAQAAFGDIISPAECSSSTGHYTLHDSDFSDSEDSDVDDSL